MTQNKYKLSVEIKIKLKNFPLLGRFRRCSFSPLFPVSATPNLNIIYKQKQEERWGFPGGSVVKNLLAMQEPEETHVRSLGQEDPLEEGMTTHCRILAGTILWTEPGRLQSMELQTVRHNWAHMYVRKMERKGETGLGSWDSGNNIKDEFLGFSFWTFQAWSWESPQPGNGNGSRLKSPN